MAEREDTSRSFNPKHRIVGAIVLVAAAVIIVPLILQNRAPKPPAAPVAEVPVPDSKVVVTPVGPQPDAASSAQATAPPMPMTPGPQPPATASAQPVPPPPSSTPQIAPEETPAPRKAEPTAPAHKKHKPAQRATARVTHGWVVQLGAFSDRENALHLKKKLERKGFRAELDRVQLGGRTGVRVRVGPVKKNSEAKVLQAHIARATGIKGVVLAFP